MAGSSDDREEPTSPTLTEGRGSTAPRGEGSVLDARYAESAALGAGGMGEVIEVTDRRLARRIAVKRLRAEVAEDASLAVRFRNEAELQGQLEHPSIVPVYDLGFDAGGRMYFTMKRVEGLTLREVVEGLRAGRADVADRFSRRKLLAAFAAVGQAVEYAHARGVVHRDVKPSNVMLGSFGEVYLLDWGVAKVLARGDVHSTAPIPAAGVDLTVSGSFLGTPGYAAPEQLLAEQVDERADVYALGALLFELLALQPLHPGATKEDRVASTLSPGEMRPSVRAPEREIPPELDVICVKATRLDRDARYRTVRELVADLERFLDGDRNLALRRELSAAHAGRAAAVAAAAPSVGADDRAEAVRVVGRALALDPDNVLAAETMMRLLSTPPRALPPEVARELEQQTRQERRSIFRLGAAVYSSFLIYVPLLLWSGVRDPWAIVLIYALFLGAALAGLVTAGRPSLGAAAVIVLASSVASAAVCTLFGSLVLVPAMVLAQTVTFSLHFPARARALAAASGVAAIVGPLALERAGVLGPSYAFESGQVSILPNAIGLGELPTLVFLVVSSIGCVVTATFAVGRIRDALFAARERLSLHAWHLRALFPGARSALGHGEGGATSAQIAARATAPS